MNKSDEAMNATIHEARELFEHTRALRRDFHRHPELGFKEVRTAGIIARELGDLGLQVSTGIAETGVVALIEGGRPGSVVLLRFDMDALPVSEQTGAEYASMNPGVMHACGHDGHIAIGLTVARLLHAHRAQWGGTVKLVFQPAEEGLGGAERMVADGVLHAPAPDVALAMHLWNSRPLGWVGVTSGPVMAAAEIFRVKVSGRGGHGAMPHLAIDPVLAGAQIISSLQSVVARNVAPLQSAVVSVTSVHGGEAFNVIPSEVEFQGTIRTFEAGVRTLVSERFVRITQDTAAAFGCQADIDLRSITPAVVNDPAIAARVQAVVARLLPEYELDSQERTMGSEDMSVILQEVPGCYFFVGSANVAMGLDAPHHHPRFDFDEQALVSASALMASAALEFLTG